VIAFTPVSNLEPGTSTEVIVNVDLHDKNKPIKFELQYGPRGRSILFASRPECR